ncbi:helix-turn-helix domain-containing protein [Methylobrevis albus]|uniref:Helix-turn-helix domain-containing protein n=1 Tax=Methylobrevis albus TaxID=2793297 RepID=A0A931I4J2_9HYPH|nr:helix-turn-helix domain-containing protein [Methylobrevis albus]MBH0239116.1 helix-turn-helix domain-containing protein [Methylobrevis albus]
MNKETIALSIDEVVKQTGISRRTLYYTIARGDLVARKMGARTLILRSELQEFLERLPRMDIASNNHHAA